MPGRRLVDPGIWSEARDLLGKPQGEDAVILFCYALTCSHSTLLGCYRLPLPYAGEDLGWPVERIEAALALLRQHGHVQYDEIARVIFVPRLLRTQAIDGPAQLKRAISDVQALPQTRLLGAVYHELKPRLSKGLSSKESARLWQVLSRLLSSGDSPAPHNKNKTPHHKGESTRQSRRQSPNKTPELTPEQRHAIASWRDRIRRASDGERSQIEQEAIAALKLVLWLPDEHVLHLLQQGAGA